MVSKEEIGSEEFYFAHPCGIFISRQLEESEVATLDGVDIRDMQTGYVWYDLPIFESYEQRIAMSICFHFGTLSSVSLAVYDPDLGSTWGEWNKEKEELRAKQTKEWLSANGYQTGFFDWGEIWAGCDWKTGDGGGGIRYSPNYSRGTDAPSCGSQT